MVGAGTGRGRASARWWRWAARARPAPRRPVRRSCGCGAGTVVSRPPAPTCSVSGRGRRGGVGRRGRERERGGQRRLQDPACDRRGEPGGVGRGVAIAAGEGHEEGERRDREPRGTRDRDERRGREREVVATPDRRASSADSALEHPGMPISASQDVSNIEIMRERRYRAGSCSPTNPHRSRTNPCRCPMRGRRARRIGARADRLRRRAAIALVGTLAAAWFAHDAARAHARAAAATLAAADSTRPRRGPRLDAALLRVLPAGAQCDDQDGSGSEARCSVAGDRRRVPDPAPRRRCGRRSARRSAPRRMRRSGRARRPARGVPRKSVPGRARPRRGSSPVGTRAGWSRAGRRCGGPSTIVASSCTRSRPTATCRRSTRGGSRTRSGEPLPVCCAFPDVRVRLWYVPHGLAQ